MKSRRFFRTLLLMSWLPLALAALGLVFQSFLITGESTRYIALGKMVIYDLESATAAVDNDINTLVEMLKSSAVMRRALERMRGLHPELKEVEVTIKPTTRKGSAIVLVSAIGEEQKYTKLFLDAILDEAVAYGQELREKSGGAEYPKLIEDVLSREKRVHASDQELAAYRREHDTTLLTAEHERLAKRVSDLRGEVESLEKTPGSEEKAKQLRLNLAQSEQKLSEINGQQVTLKEMEEKSVRDKTDYEARKESLEKMDHEIRSHGPQWAIMDRPVIAVEDKPSLLRSAASGIAMGFGLGLLMALVTAFIAAFASTHEAAELQ